MDQRILSVALALCLCVSVQPAVYGAQENFSQQEGKFTEETVEKQENSDGEDIILPEATVIQEDAKEEETEAEPEIKGDENIAPPEELPVQDDEEGETKEETEAEPEIKGDEDVAPPEELPVQDDEEGEIKEETEVEPEIKGDENITPPEELPVQDDEEEETEAEPEIGGDEDIVPPEEFPVQDDDKEEETVLIEKLADELALYAANDNVIPTPTEVYKAMTALKDQDMYKEGRVWTNEEPYSDTKGYYNWKGGLLDGKKISAAGCVAFAFSLSDEAFGSLPARMFAAGEFDYEDIKVGDILRVDDDNHTVIVLQVSDAGVVIAEGNISTGNNKGKVHWGRAMSKEVVMRDTSHYITRYPEGYVSPDDSTANVVIDSGIFGKELSWELTNAGTLTITGDGAMPNYSSAGDQPWKNNSDRIQKIIIGDGVTSIGSCAFWNCGVLSVEISHSVTAIGSSAFRGSKVISITIPSGVKTIGDSAFRECQNLNSVTFSEGLEKISGNAFRACTSLAFIDLPASIGEVGAGAFFECTEMKAAAFAPGSRQVKLGDNIFTRCYYLSRVTLPASIDCIGEGMFQNCGKLTGVQIPSGAKSIGGSAFASSGVSAVIIPDSVTSIGIAAFSSCPLEDIYFTGTEEQWKKIQKIGDTNAAVSKVTIHYNCVPSAPEEGKDPEGGAEENPGSGSEENPGSSAGENPGGGSEENPGSGSEENPGDSSSETPGSGTEDIPGSSSSETPGSGTEDIPGSSSSETPGSGTEDTPGGSSSETPGSGTENTPGGSSSETPGSSSSGNHGNASGGSSGGASSGGSDEGNGQPQNISANTAGGQWIVENTGDAKGIDWKLKRDDGTYVAGMLITDADGNIKEQVAWECVNGAWYAFGVEGYAYAGWILDEELGGWYYVDINSGMQTGWHSDIDDGAVYFLDPVSGKMLTGWNLIDGKWYYFNELAGEPTWQREGQIGEWSYTGSGGRPFGAMYKGETTPDGYVVDENGIWIG